MLGGGELGVWGGGGNIFWLHCGLSLNLGILFDASASKMRTDKHQVSILYKNIF